MNLTINGENRRFLESLTVNQLLDQLGLDGRKVALERNLEIVPRFVLAGDSTIHLIDELGEINLGMSGGCGSTAGRWEL